MTQLQDMQAEVIAWAERKGWHPSDESFGDTMALLHSEVSEALEAFRDYRLADGTKWDTEIRSGVPAKPEGVGSEFADVLIRLLHYSEKWGVDLEFEYARKMAYNEKRPFQHGGRTVTGDKS